MKIMNFGFASVRMIWVLIKTNQKKQLDMKI